MSVVDVAYHSMVFVTAGDVVACGLRVRQGLQNSEGFPHGSQIFGGATPPLKFAIIQFRVGVPPTSQNCAWVLILSHLHV